MNYLSDRDAMMLKAKLPYIKELSCDN